MQFRNLTDDPVRIKILETFKLELDRHLSIRITAKLVLNAHVQFKILSLENFVEIILVDVYRITILDHAVIVFLGKIADHQQSERKLDLFLGISGIRLVNNIDPLFWSYGTFFSHI